MKLGPQLRIGVLGLGYVGLPLAVEFAKVYRVVGYDIDAERIKELTSGHDRTREVEAQDLVVNENIEFTDSAERLDSLDVYIVTAPTPIDHHKQPDLGPVLSATRAVADHMSAGAVVIFESTVYPGATEEECVPVLESLSGLQYNVDFFVGYSPERINPGDAERRFTNIVKVTSGSTPAAANFIDELYGSVVVAGTHKAPSIAVAEAAKVIENTQRDVNIALVNELAILFKKLNIDTSAVLEAASTKWNFLPFRPGLVGGHCIGVDPYYLTHKAQAVGYHPEIILAGRRLNDSMPSYVATSLVQEMISNNIDLRGARVLVIGLTFKEDTPDLRNSKAIEVIQELKRYGLTVDSYDPCIDASELDAIDSAVLEPANEAYDAILLAVPHKQILELGVSTIRSFGKPGMHLLYDLKSALPADSAELHL